jgi:seryl-tRNA synthetase
LYCHAQVSGSKFYYLKNEAVLLEMALVSWAIAEVSKKGFTPLITPEIVRSSVVERCGFQPRAQNTQVESPSEHNIFYISCYVATQAPGVHVSDLVSVFLFLFDAFTINICLLRLII